MLAVGLREHHQFDIGRVALRPDESFQQVIDLVFGQRQPQIGVGFLQRRPAAGQYADKCQWLRFQFAEQAGRVIALAQHRFGHPVMQQGRQALCRLGCEANAAGQPDAIGHAALDAAHL